MDLQRDPTYEEALDLITKLKARLFDTESENAELRQRLEDQEEDLNETRAYIGEMMVAGYKKRRKTEMPVQAPLRPTIRPRQDKFLTPVSVKRARSPSLEIIDPPNFAWSEGKQRETVSGANSASVAAQNTRQELYFSNEVKLPETNATDLSALEPGFASKKASQEPSESREIACKRRKIDSVSELSDFITPHSVKVENLADPDQGSPINNVLPEPTTSTPHPMQSAASAYVANNQNEMPKVHPSDPSTESASVEILHQDLREVPCVKLDTESRKNDRESHQNESTSEAGHSTSHATMVPSHDITTSIVPVNALASSSCIDVSITQRVLTSASEPEATSMIIHSEPRKPMPTSTSRIDDAAPFIITSAPMTLEVPRAFLRINYGGSDQHWLQYIPPERNPSGPVRRRLVFPLLELNPAMPSSPGQPGIIFASRHEILDNPPWTVFCKRSNKAPVRWLYLGEYENKLAGKLTPEKFQAQPLVVRREWAKSLIKCKAFDVYVEMRARIALKAAGMLPLADTKLTEEEKQEEEDILVAQEVQAVRRDKGLPVDVDDIMKALCNGNESIDMIRMSCVGYDHVFANDMQDRLRGYRSKGRKKSVQVNSKRTSTATLNSSASPRIKTPEPTDSLDPESEDGFDDDDSADFLGSANMNDISVSTDRTTRLQTRRTFSN